MNFELSDEQKLVVQTARVFAREEIKPVAAQCDRESRFPQDVFAKAREIGLVNMTVPTAFGGSGWGALELALVTSELGWACTGIAGAFGLNAIFGDVFHVAVSEAKSLHDFFMNNGGIESTGYIRRDGTIEQYRPPMAICYVILLQRRLIPRVMEEFFERAFNARFQIRNLPVQAMQFRGGVFFYFA